MSVTADKGLPLIEIDRPACVLTVNDDVNAIDAHMVGKNSTPSEKVTTTSLSETASSFE